VKRILLAVATAMILAGCAHREAQYEPAYGYAGGGGGYYLSDCVYPELCGPGFYDGYYYSYFPYSPSGPLVPDRLRVERVPRQSGPRTVKRAAGVSAQHARTVAARPPGSSGSSTRSTGSSSHAGTGSHSSVSHSVSSHSVSSHSGGAHR